MTVLQLVYRNSWKLHCFCELAKVWYNTGHFAYHPVSKGYHLPVTLYPPYPAVFLSINIKDRHTHFFFNGTELKLK